MRAEPLEEWGKEGWSYSRRTYDQTCVVQLFNDGCGLSPAAVRNFEPVVEHLDYPAAHAFAGDRASVTKRF
jgi:hypothetical protein